LRKPLYAALALLVAACGAPPARAPVSHPAPAPAAAPGQRYRIDSSHSELRLLVYRAGVMAALGHDHVIVNRALEGWVKRADAPAGSAFFLTIPAAAFVVDEAAARAQEGADFSEAIGDEAKAGTLHNMLSAAVLDAQTHPSISVQSTSVEPAADGALQATVRILVAGHESSLIVPFTCNITAGRLHAQAAFTVRQTALGLTPFSALLGALRVEDELRAKLDLEAVEDQAP
jgi:polyisoprenoid-binding protein YceI